MSNSFKSKKISTRIYSTVIMARVKNCWPDCLQRRFSVKPAMETAVICAAPCIQANSGNHPDIKWVTHEKPGSIGVSDVREQLNNDIAIKPYRSKYKIYH